MRSANAAQVDVFFVTAVATILLIRIRLELAGYPRLGGGGFHIAHVLWGGLGMLVAILLLLVFRTPAARLLAAVVGGAGFGAFVDELGKFVTSDNDYFFKPTPALLYVLFVILFLTLRRVRRFRELNAEEKLVNAVELSAKLVSGGLSTNDRERALALLDGADQCDPMVPTLRERFHGGSNGRARRDLLSAFRGRGEPRLCRRSRDHLVQAADRFALRTAGHRLCGQHDGRGCRAGRGLARQRRGPCGCR